jgi:hypothetical protein
VKSELHACACISQTDFQSILWSSILRRASSHNIYSRNHLHELYECEDYCPHNVTPCTNVSEELPASIFWGFKWFTFYVTTIFQIITGHLQVVIQIQLLCFWTLSIALLSFKMFPRLDTVSIFSWNLLGSIDRASPSLWTPAVRVRVTLRLAVYHQSVHLGNKPLRDSQPVHLFFPTEHLQSKSLCDILSDERIGLLFTIAAGPHQCSRSQVHVLQESLLKSEYYQNRSHC